MCRVLPFQFVHEFRVEWQSSSNNTTNPSYLCKLNERYSNMSLVDPQLKAPVRSIEDLGFFYNTGTWSWNDKS